VAAIRTVTVTMSPIFRDLVTGLMAGHVNLDVVGNFDRRDGLEEQLRALAPNLILIGLGRNEGDEIGGSLVRLLPDAKVITFSSNGRDASVHRMQLQRVALPEVSSRVLIDTILRF
jgi:DNA-binding NarL/FixJ family response regulator